MRRHAAAWSMASSAGRRRQSGCIRLRRARGGPPIVRILGIAEDRLFGRRRSHRTRPLARTALAAAAAAAALSGCAASFNAPTNEPYQPAAGISDRSTAVYAINALVVTDGSGNGTVVGS